jgi:hypothetical protein
MAIGISYCGDIHNSQYIGCVITLAHYIYAGGFAWLFRRRGEVMGMYEERKTAQGQHSSRPRSGFTHLELIGNADVMNAVPTPH